MRSPGSLIYFCRVKTKIFKSEFLGIPEPPIPGLFGSPLVSESRGVFVRQILVDIGALALTDTGKIITASLICWLYVLCVFVNYAKYAVLKISHGIRWGELSLK